MKWSTLVLAWVFIAGIPFGAAIRDTEQVTVGVENSLLGSWLVAAFFMTCAITMMIVDWMTRKKIS